MLALTLGFLLSAIAAVPVLWLSWRGRNADFKDRLKRWALGLLIRFVIIGAGLLLLFTQTTLDKIACVIGVGIAWFISFLIEAYQTLTSKG